MVEISEASRARARDSPHPNGTARLRAVTRPPAEPQLGEAGGIAAGDDDVLGGLPECQVYLHFKA
jgi:hypothetical protein